VTDGGADKMTSEIIGVESNAVVDHVRQMIKSGCALRRRRKILSFEVEIKVVFCDESGVRSGGDETEIMELEEVGVVPVVWVRG
jgi:hypothetical protein